MIYIYINLFITDMSLIYGSHFIKKKDIRIIQLLFNFKSICMNLTLSNKWYLSTFIY